MCPGWAGSRAGRSPLFPLSATSFPSHRWQSHGLATAPEPFTPTTQVQRREDGGTHLQQPPLNLPQAGGESPAPAPSPTRLQPNCKSFPGREAGGCLGCAPRAGLAGAARVPLPRARGSPCLLSSRRTGGGCITRCQPAAPAGSAAHTGEQPVPPSRSRAGGGSSPGHRAGHGAQGKPGQGAGCAPTFSKSWEPLAHESAGKEAPRELNISAWLHIAVPQTPSCPAEPPPAFLTSSSFPGATSAFLENK